MKKVLILNGSFCEEPIIIKAKEMGYYVITTGNMPNLSGHKYSDKYIEADYSDKDAILKIVDENDIDGIIPCANDFGVLTAAYIAEKKGWKGHDSYEIAKTLHHKDLFKAYLKKNDILSPISYRPSDINDAKRYIHSIEYPIIVKANDLTGGKGIMRANNIDEAIIAIDNAYNMSRDKVIVIEPFIIGTQHTFGAFLINKKIVCSYSCNCYSPINPYLIQSETLPADQIDVQGPKLSNIIEFIANDFNLVDGIMAVQYILKDGEPYIIETMRRSFGNQFLTLSDLFTGFDWEEAYIKAALGLSCEDIPIKSPTYKFCGHHGIMAQKNATIKDYEIDPEIEKHIFKKIDMIKPGEKINNYLNERIAYIYYSYDSKEEMDKAVKTFNNKIRISYYENDI